MLRGVGVTNPRQRRLNRHVMRALAKPQRKAQGTALRDDDACPSGSELRRAGGMAQVRGQSVARNGRLAVYDADVRELWLRSEALTGVHGGWSIAS
jgi:hypothetical protein